MTVILKNNINYSEDVIQHEPIKINNKIKQHLKNTKSAQLGWIDKHINDVEYIYFVGEPIDNG